MVKVLDRIIAVTGNKFLKFLVVIKRHNCYLNN